MSASSKKQHQQESNHAWSSLFKARFNSTVLREVDTELETLQLYATQVRQRRNALVGACTLPIETLSYIFRLVQNDWKPRRWKAFAGPDLHHAAHYTLGWMTLAHICSTWRKIVVNDPTLWACVETLAVNPLAIHTILSRSGRQPLKLSFASAESRDYITPRSIGMWLSSPVHHRVQALSITFHDDSVLEHLPPHLPHLRTLKLDFDGPDADIHKLTQDNLRYPELTHLTLNKVTAPYQSPIFAPTVTHLHWSSLETNNLDTSLHPDGLCLSRILGCMPNLESLFLDEVVRAVHHRHPTKYTIPPCLGFIHLLFWDVDDLDNIFAHIDLSASATVVVEILDMISASLVRRVADALFQGAYASQPEPRELLLTEGCLYVRPHPAESSVPSWLNRRAGVQRDEVYDSRSRCLKYDRQSDIFLSSDDEDRREASDGGRYLPYIPFASIVSITFYEYIEYSFDSSEAWLGIFSEARGVRSLYIPIEVQFMPLFTAMQETVGSAFALFPNLQNITLGLSICGIEQDQDMQAQLTLAVMYMVQERLDGGAPIRTMHIAREAESWPGDPWVGVRELVEVSFFD